MDPSVPQMNLTATQPQNPQISCYPQKEVPFESVHWQRPQAQAPTALLARLGLTKTTYIYAPPSIPGKESL